MSKKVRRVLALIIFSIFLVGSGLIIYQISQVGISRKTRFNNHDHVINRNHSSHRDIVSSQKSKELNKKYEQNNSEAVQPTNEISTRKSVEIPPLIEKEEKFLPPKEEENVETTKEELTEPTKEPKIPLPSSNLPNKEEKLKIVNGRVQVPKR